MKIGIPGVIVMASCCLMVWYMDDSHNGSDLKQYCEMVKIHIETEGKNGWPDFDKKYDAECNNE